MEAAGISLRNIFKGIIIGKVRNEEVLRKCKKKFGICGKADESVLKEFGHAERMRIESLVKTVC